MGLGCGVYWNESMKLRASCALSEGRYLSTCVRLRFRVCHKHLLVRKSSTRPHDFGRVPEQLSQRACARRTLGGGGVRRSLQLLAAVRQQRSPFRYGAWPNLQTIESVRRRTLGRVRRRLQLLAAAHASIAFPFAVGSPNLQSLESVCAAHLGEGAEKLEHGALEGRAVILLLLLHELADHRLRLPELRHRERAHLVLGVDPDFRFQSRSDVKECALLRR